VKNVFTIFKREFKSYFDSPVAYVFLTAFLALVGFLTFAVARFYEMRQADLARFFFWHPWVYLLLVPAATMGTWADERRNGTLEQLLTLPITVWEALVGKFLAAWAFIGLALALTFPVVLTVGYLGAPDWGAIACGYLGSLLLAGAATAVGVFASALSRSSVVGFVVSLALTFLLLIIGFSPFIGAIASWGVPAALVDLLAGCSLLTHFEALQRGVADLADVGFYLGAIVFFLAAAKTVTDGRRGASKGALGLVILAVIVVAADVILAKLPLRADLTAEKLYTLSKGSRAVLAQLDADVTLKYYVSSSAAEMPAPLKLYATQVENLLQEYDRAAKGRLAIEKYDPKPDSDAEEWAQRYGVEPQTLNPFGAPVYFGLVAVCGDREATLGVLSPSTEATLEYDVTRLVTRVAWPEKPVVGVMTSLEGVTGGGAPLMRMRRNEPQGWAAINELGKDYDVRTVATDADQIPDEVKTLVLIHAKDLSDETLFAIDQFVLRGGKLIACVDPMSLKEIVAVQSQQQGMGMMFGGDGPSTLGKLFDAWGVTFDTDKVTSDLSAATRLNNGANGVAEEPAFLTLGAANMDTGDILVAGLTQVMFPFAGAFTFAQKEGGDLVFTPVITTSAQHSGTVGKFSILMGGGASEARPDGVARVVAARLAGTFKSAFADGMVGTNKVENVTPEGRSSVLLFADSDFLADDFCVRLLRTPFGTMAQPLNDNLALFSNVIEQFAGREELIGVRTRGPSDRPFEVVNRLEAEALAKWQQKEEALRQKLQEVQAKVNELQRQKSGSERLLLTREQQDEIVKFRKAQAATSRELKNVRKELTADIDALGFALKCVNIVLVPVLVVLFGLARFFLRKRS